MELKPDIEVIFEFLNDKNYFNGYRPSHLISESYLTTGVHNYYEEKCNGKTIGTITFISPEDYPNSIWIGKKITMYEGKKIIGYATVVKVFNKILLS